jgi:hypothetical protein
MKVLFYTQKFKHSRNAIHGGKNPIHRKVNFGLPTKGKTFAFIKALSETPPFLYVICKHEIYFTMVDGQPLKRYIYNSGYGSSIISCYHYS